MNHERNHRCRPPGAVPAHAAVGVGESRAHSGAAEPTGVLPAALPTDALDDRIAIVGTAGSGKTYAAKGFVERLLDIGARVAIVDPLGVWWGLRASADGSAAGYPAVVFGGKHADVPITAETGPALGRMIASEALACVVDLSELGSNAARRRFHVTLALCRECAQHLWCWRQQPIAPQGKPFGRCRRALRKKPPCTAQDGDPGIPMSAARFLAEHSREFGRVPILSQRRLGQDCPSRDKWGQPHPKCGWQDRRCWPTTRCLTRPRLDSDPCHSPSNGVMASMMPLPSISV
jgi:hypothetical protein